MPAVSKKQQMFMGADLARARAGKKTKTKMSATQLEKYAGTKRDTLPTRIGSSKGKHPRRKGK